MNYKRPEKLYLFETQRGLGVALENSQLVIASAKGIISSVPHVIDSRYSVGLKAFAIAFTQVFFYDFLFFYFHKLISIFFFFS